MQRGDGQALSDRFPLDLTFQIHLDFEVAVEKFKGVPYDILDVAAKQVRPSRDQSALPAERMGMWWRESIVR